MPEVTFAICIWEEKEEKGRWRGWRVSEGWKRDIHMC